MNAKPFLDLSAAQKLQLIEELWDDLSSQPNDVPVHDWQLQELERREENLRQNPGSTLKWEDVVSRIRARYGR